MVYFVLHFFRHILQRKEKCTTSTSSPNGTLLASNNREGACYVRHLKLQAFNLVELLVLIAIISILMRVLMPSLQGGTVHHSSSDASVTAISSATTSTCGKVITIAIAVIVLSVCLQHLYDRDDKAILISRRIWLIICRLLLNPIINRFTILLNDTSKLIDTVFDEIIVPADEYIRFAVVIAPPNGPNARDDSVSMYRRNSIGTRSLKGNENGFEKVVYGC